MAQETPFVFHGLRVSFDPLVHRGTLHVHPDDGRLMGFFAAKLTQDERDQMDAAAFAQEPEDHHEG